MRLTRISTIAAALGADDIAREAADVAQRLAAGRLFVTCLGQFKRGKSTLLNALLERNVLPTGVAPVTSVVTIVRYGKQLRAAVQYLDGRSESIEVPTLPQYVSEEHNPDNTKEVAAVEIDVPSELLADGLCLVDTPGLGSVSVAGSEITRHFVPHVDAALVVLGVDPPITEDELTLVEQVARETRTLMFVLNKADKSRHEDVVEACAYTERVLEKRLGTQVEVFAVSAIEVVELHHETRQWMRLEAALHRIAAGGESSAVRWREERVAHRLLQQLRREAQEQRRALLEPIEATETRVRALQAWLTDGDAAMRELSHRLRGQQEALDPVFATIRDAFLRDAPARVRALLQDHVAALSIDRHLDDAALGAAHDIVERVVKEWLDAVEPVAARHYSEVTARFADQANELLRRLAETEPALAELPPLQPDATFRMNRGFYFAGLTRLMSRSLVTRLSLAAGERRRQQVQRRAEDYAHRLIEVNASRVYEDLRQRVFESRRALEAELRQRLTHLSESASRALTLAAQTRAQGEAAVRAGAERLDAVINTIDAELSQSEGR